MLLIYFSRMELEDFCHNFNYLSISCENPNFIDGDLSCQWNLMSYNGSWVAGSTSGGGIGECKLRFSTQNALYGVKIFVKSVETKRKKKCKDIQHCYYYYHHPTSSGCINFIVNYRHNHEFIHRVPVSSREG